MANYINRITLVGNAGAPAQFYTYGQGQEMCNFSLATSRSWLDRSTNQWQSQTEWHRITVFDPRLVQVCKGIEKGSYICVEGELRYRKYTDTNGVERTSADIHASSVFILNRPVSENSGYQQGFQGGFQGQQQGYGNQGAYGGQGGNFQGQGSYGSQPSFGAQQGFNGGNNYGSNQGSGFPNQANQGGYGAQTNQNPFSQQPANPSYSGQNQGFGGSFNSNDANSFTNTNINNSGSSQRTDNGLNSVSGGFTPSATASVGNSFNESSNSFSGAFASKPEPKAEKKESPATSLKEEELPF